jgi:phage terminase large subunit
VLPFKTFFDIGGAGHSSDAMAIWICQFVAREIRLLDCIEGVGQPLGFYANELRRRGWKDAIIHLPHDGVATNNISGKRYIDHWAEAGAPLIKNSEAGARYDADRGRPSSFSALLVR